MNWADCCKEEKHAMREWSLCWTGIVRHRNEMGEKEYQKLKKKMDGLLTNIKENYDGIYTD